MKVKLQFDLPEEKEEYEIISHGMDYYLCLNDIKEWLRQKIKYDESKDINIETLEKVQDKFYEIINDRGIEI